MKRMTFGEELLQFAKTVDILNKNLFFKVKGIINDYAYRRWGVRFVKIMRLKLDADGNRILEKFFWDEYTGSGYKGDMVNIDNSKGQMAFVIHQKKPAWITCADRVSYLDDCNQYRDCWSDLKNIPNYQAVTRHEKMKTSTIVPFYEEIGQEEKYLRGVANFETPHFILFNDEHEQEIKYLTETIAELLNLYTIRERQESNTNFAINKLRYKLDIFPQGHRENKVFIASSIRGAHDVKEAILEVLNFDFPNIGIVDWEENYEPGSVTETIFSEIEKCMYGICYFSEKDESSKNYVDNINVVFEAGLMHAKFRSFKDETPLWIPIREKDSPQFPFDVKDFNTIVVPRDEKEKLIVDEFKEKLRRFLITTTKQVKKSIMEVDQNGEGDLRHLFEKWFFK